MEFHQRVIKNSKDLFLLYKNSKKFFKKMINKQINNCFPLIKKYNMIHHKNKILHIQIYNINNSL